MAHADFRTLFGPHQIAIMFCFYFCPHQIVTTVTVSIITVLAGE